MSFVNLPVLVNELRMKAHILYSMGKKNKALTPERLEQQLRPIRQSLNDLIKDCALHRPGECAATIRSLKGEIKFYESEMKFFLQKIQDCQIHIDKIKSELIGVMEEKKTTMINQGGFYILLTDNEGKKDIEIK